MTTKIKKIIISSGEPAGIGPEQIIKLAQYDYDFEWVVLADKQLLKQTAKQLNLPVIFKTYQLGQPPKKNTSTMVKIIHISLREKSVAGKLNIKNTDYVLEILTTAVKLCMDNKFNALVTAPVHKGIINKAGTLFTGHTELLAEQSNSKQVVMMLTTPGLRVPLVTTHLPLKDISRSITAKLLESVIRILHNSLQNQFNIANPKIYIMGLNPHAGEDGHLGMEEIETINPVINQLKKEGMNLIGSLPADTIFSPNNRKDADAFLAMYHDQGLPVLKYVGFGNAVNVTLGLPFVRTSVDHGTALNIAGTGQADIKSFQYAMQVAIDMIGKI
jgi:4-hydroxythreonine-4-phosphate dehydrogenase